MGFAPGHTRAGHDLSPPPWRQVVTQPTILQPRLSPPSTEWDIRAARRPIPVPGPPPLPGPT